MTGTEEVYQRFVDLSDENGGLTVLNDGKYSYSAIGGELRLTVANTSIYADHFGQKYRDDSCRHMDLGEQNFRYTLIPHKGPWQNVNPTRRAALMHRMLEKTVETYHDGFLPAKYEGLSVSEPNLCIGAIKRAENDDGWILRLVETQGKDCKATIRAQVLNREIAVTLTPWQIKTLFVPDAPETEARYVLLTEEPE